jgi:hypothetical protein
MVNIAWLDYVFLFNNTYLHITNRDFDYQLEYSQLKACKEGDIVRSDRTYYTVDKMRQQINVKSDVIEKTVPVDIRINKISCTQSKSFSCYSQYIDLYRLM